MTGVQEPVQERTSLKQTVVRAMNSLGGNGVIQFGRKLLEQGCLIVPTALLQGI
jgi:hypothetical protein